jgi:hypothetical protein
VSNILHQNIGFASISNPEGNVFLSNYLQTHTTFVKPTNYPAIYNHCKYKINVNLLHNLSISTDKNFSKVRTTSTTIYNEYFLGLIVSMTIER